MVDGDQIRLGLKSRNQVPLFMIWRERWIDGEIVHAWVVFNSRTWLGI